MNETFKTEEKKAVTTIGPKKKFVHLLDNDYTEVKRLAEEDVEDAVKVMRKCSFDVTDKEIIVIVQYNISFGCYVNRMLIGVGLSWPTHFDEERKEIRNGETNAVYMEDPAVLLAYEGRGIRRMLLQEREKDAKAMGLKYVIAYLSEDLPTGGLEDYIRETGSQLEKLFLSENYNFIKTNRGVMAFKRL